MARLVNFLLVGSALGALVFGGIFFGSKIRDDSVRDLTESIPADAAAATADAQLRGAMFAASTYFVRQSSYVGMTADVLRQDVDAGLAPNIAIEDVTRSEFCVETTVGEHTFSYHVRRGFPTPGSGC